MTETAVIDRFTQAYLVAALWSSTDDLGEPLDRNYSITDIALSALDQMTADCKKFQDLNQTLIEMSGLSTGQAGHDFWLTRNGHGAGFWDREIGKWGELLTEAAKKFPECDLYVGDDGAIYVE